MPVDLTSSTLTTQDNLQTFSEETLSLINKSIDAVHNLKYLTVERTESAIEGSKEKNKKLLQKVDGLLPPHDLTLHYGILVLMGSLTRAPLTSMALMIHSLMPKKENASTKLVMALSILGREVGHPTTEGEGLGFQTILPTVAKKILVAHYKISDDEKQKNQEKIDYAAIRENASTLPQTVAADENPALIKKGETLSTIIKDIVSREGMLSSYSNVDYEKFISIAIDHILQDQKRYNLTSATRQELLTGTSVDRQEIKTLLKTLESKIANGENLAQEKEGGDSHPEKEKPVYSGVSDSSVSDVVASWRDSIHQDFLTDGFRIVIKKICNISDTANLEVVFIKYCDKSVSELTESLKTEPLDIQKEVLAFLTWVRNSYLSSQKPEMFEKLPFYSVIEAVARGVNGTPVNGTKNSKITIA